MDLAPFLQWRNAMEHPKASYSVTEVIESINSFYRNIKQTEHTNLRIFVWEVNPWISHLPAASSLLHEDLDKNYQLLIYEARDPWILPFRQWFTDGGRTVDEVNEDLSPPKKQLDEDSFFSEDGEHVYV